jgi:hypothetical protein
MTESPVIKVEICVAYDWEMLRTCIPRIYNSADIICLGLDKDRHAWSGERFDFDNQAFRKFISDIDVEKKIKVYEEDFSLSELDKRQNCNRHRKMMADYLGVGGWHVQVDADEYFLDFEGFTAYLKKLNPAPSPEQRALNVNCPFIPLIKKIPTGYLYVDFMDRLPEIIPMATNRPDYQRARQNGHFNHITPFYVVHETWARSEEELWFKINNWGHASEELTEVEKTQSYFNLWKALDVYNYRYVRNFHPILSDVWPALKFAEGSTIDDMLRQFKLPDFPLTEFQRRLKNSRNIARLKALFP